MNLLWSPPTLMPTSWLHPLHQSHTEASSLFQAILSDELADRLPALFAIAFDQKQNLIELALSYRIHSVLLQMQTSGEPSRVASGNIQLTTLLAQWSEVQALKERAYATMRVIQLPNMSPFMQKQLVQKLSALSQRARLKGLSQLEADIQAFIQLSGESARLGARLEESIRTSWRARSQNKKRDPRLLQMAYWQAMLHIHPQEHRAKLAAVAYVSLSDQMAQYWRDLKYESWPQHFHALEELMRFLNLQRQPLGIPSTPPDQLRSSVTKMLNEALMLIRNLPAPRSGGRSEAIAHAEATLQDIVRHTSTVAHQGERAENPSALQNVLTSVRAHLNALKRRIPKI